jgi:hypothetical protein
MKNPRSSTRAEPWFAHRWPWFIIAGPLVVVIASLATTVIAVRTDDGVVAGDYYKQGLLVNRRLPSTAAPAPHYAATLVLDGRRLAVRPDLGDVRGDALVVTLSHPASGARETLALHRDADGDFVGEIASGATGRWIVAFDARDWPLPTTVVERGAAPTSVRVATSSAIR